MSRMFSFTPFLTITVTDGLNPFVRGWLDNNPRMKSSVLGSVGYMVTGHLKKASRGDIPANDWAERWSLARRRQIDKQAPRKWYGRLHNAIGYMTSDDREQVDIGWLSSTAAMYGDIQERGLKRPITPFTRRFFGRRGIHFRKNTRFLVLPARPFIEPKYDEIRSEIPKHVEKQVVKYIRDGGFMKKIGKTRKYEVYK